MKSPISKRALAPNSLSAPPPRRLGRRDLPVATLELARFLLGKVVLRAVGDTVLAGRIVETEAYAGGGPSSHAFRGLTARNRSMFAAHAHAYVYLIYGTSYCLNVSSEAAGVGGAVLIRALEPLAGLGRMRALRGRPEVRDWELARGPGNLCRALAIGPDLDGIDLDTDRRLQLADDGTVVAVGASRRIGITKAVEREHRFYVPGNRSVSGPRALSP